MANIIPGSPVAFGGMPTDGLVAGIVYLLPALAGSLRDAVIRVCVSMCVFCAERVFLSFHSLNFSSLFTFFSSERIL